MTTIGTPLSPRATRVMLLGSGELGREVLIALQRLGVETIAVDRYENAPGHQIAHHARVISMTDPEQLRVLIEAEKPDLVVPEIEAIATATLEALETEGVVRVIPTAQRRGSPWTARVSAGSRRRHLDCPPALTNSAAHSMSSRRRSTRSPGRRLPLRGEAAHEQLRQGAEQARRTGRCREGLGLRDGG